MIVLVQQIVPTNAPNPITDLETIASNLFGVATSIVGVAIFVMFLVGAFQYLTAGNDEKSAEKARMTFTFAAIGGAAMIFLYFAFLILKQFTGIDLLQFKVCITGTGAFCQ